MTRCGAHGKSRNSRESAVGRVPEIRHFTKEEKKASELFKTEYTYDVEEIAQFAGVVVLHLLD
jgi:hypothetical protein